MESFSYENIFATKGIEYMIVIGFFIILVPFWMILTKNVKTRDIKNAFGVLTTSLLKVPKGLFFNKNHTWTFLEKSGIAKVGIDDLLQHITGEVRIKMLKNTGEEIKKGDLITEIEHDDKKLKIYSPISGKIEKSNSILIDNPEILNFDPYNKGWIYSIEPAEWFKDTSPCYFAEEAVKWTTRELDRFKEFLVKSLHKYSPESSMIALQDGGSLRDRILPELPVKVWDDFQKEFLD